jgi:hypothetical protein
MVQAGFGLALVPESSVRDELRQGTLVTLDVPPMRTTIPITAIHRRTGYLSAAAEALLAILVAAEAGEIGRTGAEVLCSGRRSLSADAIGPDPRNLAHPFISA